MIRLFSLYFVAAKSMDRLGSHAEMPHHWNADTGHRSHPIGHHRATFQLDGLGPGLQKPSSIAKRILMAGLIGHEGHIADDERLLGSPSHQLRVVEHVVHCHRKCIGLPLYDHAQ